MQKKPKESEIQSAILKYLRLKGIAYKNSTTGIFDPTRKVFRKNKSAGYPDITFFHKIIDESWIPVYRLIFFEVKRDKKSKLSPEQEAFKKIVTETEGIKYYIVTSLDEVMYILGDKQ